MQARDAAKKAVSKRPAAADKPAGAAAACRGTKRKPAMPTVGEQVKYLDCSVSCKESKYVVRIPRAVSKTGKECCVDRVHGDDLEASYAGCLAKIESMVYS